ncbi:MAG: hypothetical protein ACI9MF_001194, partial [Gammaproteobacteria bacterium]
MNSTLHYFVGLNLFGRMPAPRPPWSNEFDPTLLREEIDMAHQFAKIAFTESVREVQTMNNSRENYSGLDNGEDHNHILGERETTFIQAR